MNEVAQQVETDGNRLINQLRSASERQAQLFAVSCCRRVWELMMDSRHRAAVEMAERLADGDITEADFLESAMKQIIDKWRQLPSAILVEWKVRHYLTGATRHLGSASCASYAASYCARGLARSIAIQDSQEWIAITEAEGSAQWDTLRDILGPELRPIDFNPAWRTEHTFGIAAKMYEDRDFAAMPILADALEEAGCDNADILTHCREPGVHVRGCWVVDLLLEKA